MRSFRDVLCTYSLLFVSLALTSCGGGSGGGSVPPPIPIPSPMSSQNPTSNINWTDVRQQIDGFGAADMFTGKNLSDAQADLFFSPSAGIGLSILRSRIPPDGSIEDPVTMQKAVARGARVFASPLSPPAFMKDNNNVDNGGSLLPQYYQAWAEVLATYIKNVRSQVGVNLYSLSVQNEPEFAAPYESAIWTDAQLNTFIKHNLGPTFASNGFATKIMMPETGCRNQLSSYADTTMNDPTAAAYVGIIGTHDYCADPPSSYPLGQNQGKALWETEVSSFGAFDASIGDALMWAKQIHDWMTNANANAWNWWWIIGHNNDNEGLVNNGVQAKRIYTIGNYSKFVRPGWVRIGADANPTGGVYVSAYKNPQSGNFAIVAINQNGSNVSLNFSLNGFTASSVTPWITSASQDLAQQWPLGVGNGFGTTLPAQSTTTFVGTGF